MPRIVSSKLLLLIVFLALAGALVLVNVLGIAERISEPLAGPTASVQEALWRGAGTIDSFFSSVFSAGQVRDKLAQCRAQDTLAAAQQTELRELREENEALRTALDIELRDTIVFTPTAVVGHTGTEQRIVVNKGARDGIEKGAPVITPQRQLVGNVKEVFPHSAAVALLSNASISFAAELSEKDIGGVVTGTGDSLEMRELPKTADVSTGDLITTSRASRSYPSQLPVAEVTDISENDIDPFQVASLTPLFDLGQSPYLFIITDF